MSQQDGVLALGQAGERKTEGVWLWIVFRNGSYLTWGEEDNEEFRELMDYDPEQPLPQIKVRRFNNPERNSYVRNAVKKYRRVGNIPPEVELKINKESVAHTVLEDWRLIGLKDGTVPDYSPEAAIQAFKDDPDFYETVVAAGLNEDFHRAMIIEQDAEALGEFSGGTLNGDPTLKN